MNKPNTLRDDLTATWQPYLLERARGFLKRCTYAIVDPLDLSQAVWARIWRHPVRFYWLTCDTEATKRYFTTLLRNCRADIIRSRTGSHNYRVQLEPLSTLKEDPLAEPHPGLATTDDLDTLDAATGIIGQDGIDLFRDFTRVGTWKAVADLRGWTQCKVYYARDQYRTALTYLAKMEH